MTSTLIFEDVRSRTLLTQLQCVAAKDDAVLITGPTGSGKEIIARLLHEHSKRRNGPFVAVHCGAISEKLCESAFFGHVKGAFSGAITDHVGYLAEASGGTLFLDELGELPFEHQIKLLRVLDGHPYRPVGASKDRHPDVRVVGATNRNLEIMCREGGFREDLYGRISHFVLAVPPLDERPTDVRALAQLYASQHRPGDTRFADDLEAAAARLCEHPGAWPLGIRQVQAFASRADCFGVEEAELGMLGEWQRRRSPMTMVARAPAPHRDDRQALAGLIQARLRKKDGKQPVAASRPGSLAMAELLLGSDAVSYERLQGALGNCDPRTLLSNLKPLIEVGLLVDDGDRVTLTWPPVVTRFFQRRDGAWTVVPPGTIPLARGGERFRVEVTAQLPMELKAFVVTHRRDASEPRRLVARKLVSSDQTKPVELALDDQPGFEQILVHLAWPAARGIVEVAPEKTSLEVPRLHLLQRERMGLLEHIGPGCVEELLVHHL